MERESRRQRRTGWGAFVVVWLVGGLVAWGSAATDSVEEIRLLAEEGDAGAQYRMAQLQLAGNGVEKDEAQGVEWLRKAAEQGVADAQFRFAFCLKKGVGCEPDAAGARQWLEAAARNGHKTAAAMTADPESREGLRWRAQKGNRAAQRKLGWSLLGVDMLSSFPTLGFGLATGGSETEVAEGLKWLAEAAQRGDAEAARMSAWYYQQRDETKAFYWWNRAADLGSGEAQWKMVERCRSGLGTRANETEAFRWCRKLAECGDVRAMKEVAAAYESGRGCTKDYGEAKRWYERARDGAGVQRMERMLHEKPGGGGLGFHFKSKDVRIRGPGSLPGHVR